MRGDDEQQLDVFSYVSPEQRIPQNHPLRPLRVMADDALHELQFRFRKLYAKTGRPSIAPEKLLRALLLQVLYSVRSERMLMEQLDYNLLFRWFVGLNMDDAIWDVTVFTKNRQRLLAGDIADAFFAAVLKQAHRRDLLSNEHFTVDGTLLEAWAGQKSFRRIEDNQQPPAAGTGECSNPTVNFHGEKRSNETHCSITDPDAMLARKSLGTGAVLAYRNGKSQPSSRFDADHPSLRFSRARCCTADGRIAAGNTPRHFGRRQRLRHPRLYRRTAPHGDNSTRRTERHEPPQCRG